MRRRQLPTGSCVLKPTQALSYASMAAQLPTGSCVLKLSTHFEQADYDRSYLRVAVC